MFHGLDADGAAVVLYDFVAEVESDTGGLAGGLRREEGVENLVDNGLLDADAVVAEYEAHLLGFEGDTQRYFGLVGRVGVALALFHDGIHGVAENVHEGLAELFGIAIDVDILFGDVENDADGILGNLLLEIGVDHLLVLLEDGIEQHGNDAAGTVLEHFLHGLQRARGIGTVLADFLEVALEHVEHFDGIVVVVGIHVFLFVLDVGLYVANQSLRELREVVDVVEGIEDAVDESLSELTHRGHLLQTDNFGGAFLHEVLQALLILLETAQTELEECVDDDGRQEQVDEYHVPSEVEWCCDAEVDADDVGHLSEGIAGLYLEDVFAVGEVAELFAGVEFPWRPVAAVNAGAVLRREQQAREVDGVVEDDVVFDARQFVEFVWLWAVATPDDAVAAQQDGAKQQSWLCTLGCFLEIAVDDVDALVAAYPQEIAVGEHGADGVVHERIDECGLLCITCPVLIGVKAFALVVGEPRDVLRVMIGERGIADGGCGIDADGHELVAEVDECRYLVVAVLGEWFEDARTLVAPQFAVEVLQPDAARRVAHDLHDFLDIVQSFALSVVIVEDAFDAATIEAAVLFDKQRHGIVGRESGGLVVGRNAIDAVCRCRQQGVILFGELPAGMGDVGNGQEFLAFETVESAERSGIEMIVQLFKGQYLAAQSLVGGEMHVDGGECNAEDTVVGSTPEQPVAVVVHVADIVGAETVLFGDTEQFTAIGVDEDDAVAVGGQCLQTVLEVFHLSNLNVSVDGIVLAIGSGTGLAWRQLVGVVVDSINLLIAGKEKNVAVLLPYPLYLAVEGCSGVTGMHMEVAALVDLEIAEIVVSTGPEHAVGVLENGGDTAYARRVDDTPVGIVVVEQSFEIGDIDRAVVSGNDVEVLVVSHVFGGRIVTQVGDALGV